MKQIILSNSSVIYVSKIDFIFLSNYTWHLNSHGYVVGWVNGKMRYMGRIIAARMGLDLSNCISYIDRNKLNNCRNNLRSATLKQIHANNGRKINRKISKSGYKGVYFIKKYLKALITVNGKQIYLGSFDDPEKAHKAYCRAFKKYHGKLPNSKKHKNNKSGFKGVYFSKKHWRALITVKGKTIRLGNFDTLEKAHEAYCKAATKYFGEVT